MNLSQEIKKIIQKYEREGCQDHGCTNRKFSIGTNSGCHCAQSAAGEIVIFLATHKDFAMQELLYTEHLLGDRIE